MQFRIVPRRGIGWHLHTRYYTQPKYSSFLSLCVIRTGEIGDLAAPCNSNCSCARSYYDPVCGADGVQYFSACYAGCSSQSSDHVDKVGMSILWNIPLQCPCPPPSPPRRVIKQAEQ